jgi:hypothetical protein
MEYSYNKERFILLRKLVKINKYLFTQHALDRINSRDMTISLIINTIENPYNNVYYTYNKRIIYSNDIEGISVVVEKNTGIIITVTEMESRLRSRNRKEMLGWTSRNSYFRPIIV